MTTSADVARIETGAAIAAATPRTSKLAAWQTAILTGLLIVILLALVIPPFVFLVQGSFTIAGPTPSSWTWGLGNFETVLKGRHIVTTTINSVVFAAASAALALLVGWVTAWIVERTNTPLKPLAYLTAIISLGTPYILYVTAWLLFFGKAGPVNHLYRTLTGNTDVLINIYSMFGMVLVEGFLWSPLAFLLVSATLRNANPELEEAARVHGAGVWQTIRRVTMRLSLPSIMALAMLVFIRAVEAFEVPALVGLPGRISVLTTDIYTNMVARAPPDIGGSSALSVLMLLLVFVLLYVYGRLSRHAERFATITGKGFRPRPFDLGRLRYVAAGILVFNFILLLLVPMLMLVWVSLLPFFQPVSAAALKLVSLNNYRTVSDSGHVELMTNTLMVAVATATIAVGLTFVAGWLAVRRAPRRLDRRSPRDHSAGVPRPDPRHRGDAALPQRADPDLRHARHPDLGLRHPLSALRHALQRVGHAADPSRAGRSRGDLRRHADHAAAADRGAAAGAGAARGLAVHLPDVGARAVAADPAVGAALADDGGGDVRSVGQRAGHRARRARPDVVDADDRDRHGVLFVARRSAGGALGRA